MSGSTLPSFPDWDAGEQREIVGVLDTSGLPGGAYEICVMG
jgi:hypothetical protein